MTQRIEEIRKEIAELQEELDSFCAEDYTTEEQFNDMLDEVYNVIEIMGMTYNPSTALKRLDPVAYNCSFSNYCDGLDVEDFEEYKAIEQQIEDLLFELADLEA